MRTMTVVRQYLAAAFFIVIGFIAYGCGDSATVNPVVELASLSVNPGTLQPAFSGGTTSYRVDLTSDIATVTVTAQPAVSGDTVTIDGQATTSRTITLDPPGETTVVDIVVSESATSSRTYTVRLVRADRTGNNSLENLTVTSGTLAPAFDANTQDYTVDVANNVGTVNVTPTLDDPNATMTVNGQAAISGQPRTITLNPAGQSTLITTVVTAQNSTTKSYRIAVSRGVSANNNLSGLTISSGTLNFNPNTTSYTVNVGSNVTSVTVRPTLADTSATMTVNGQATNSGVTRTFQLGATGPVTNTPIIIIVTAQNDTQKTYSVNVVRAALGGNNNLSALTVSPGSLNSAFDPDDQTYTVNVASSVSSITVTPTRQDPNATITVNGTPATSGQGRSITLNGAGSNTVINILVTAPNGSQKPYTITVIQAALGGNNNLSALTVSPGPLVPAFTSGNTTYSVDVVSTVTSVTVTPTRQDPNATITVNGTPATSGQARAITLRATGLSTTINIVVTAPNGSQRPYTITVDRAAASSNNNLSGLRVNGSSVPGFTQATLNYTVNVASGVNEVIVSATKADPDAVMSVGSVTVPAGTATGQTTVPVNATPISIAVTAPSGGAPRIYTITVRQGPPAPASAPDLIPQDDSCEINDVNPELCDPGTSREDNITNVTTPRFRIPPPGAGEIPNLHVDGSEINSLFNQAANTLIPVASLNDGNHTIAYTLSNAGATSPPSPSLTVTIDTVPPEEQ